MPDDVFIRPLGKRNLAHELRFDPNRATQPGIFWYHGKWPVLSRDLVECFFQLNSQRVAEARARAPRINQLAVIIDTQDQRAKRNSLFGQRISRNDELLPPQAFDLQPVSTARKFIH